MDRKFKIGNMVKITDPGHQYDTYIEKAIELRADVSEYVRDCFVKGNRLDYKIAKQDIECKWVCNLPCHRGDICVIVNMKSQCYILVERIQDGKQFIMESSGLKFHKRLDVFNDEDFLL